MPPGVRLAAWSACILAGAGIAIGGIAGRSSLSVLPPWLAPAVVAIPATFTLAAGFSERQAWTRPLLVLLPLAGSVAALLVEAPALSALGALSSLALALYLYGTRAPRAYYRSLSEEAVVRVASADLGKLEFLPLYLGAVGLAVGAWLGALVVRSLSDYHGLHSFHDLYGWVGVVVLSALSLGYVLRLFGEAIISRRSRAA
jgi:hypothetical protein